MFFSKYNNLTIYIKRHLKTLAPFLTPLKGFNIGIALLEMKQKKIKNKSLPFIFRIDPASLCNLRCVSCDTHKVQTKEKRVMDLKDYLHIIDKIKKYALRTSLYDMGEPLVNQDIYKMISYSSDNKISTLISTNFNLFKESDIESLLNSRLTVLEPCLDGFTQEKYEMYRKNGDVEKVKENIKNVMAHKLKKQKKYPIMDVQIVNFDHIQDEIPLIKDFCKKHKVDNITIRHENLGFNSPETSAANKSTPSDKPCFWLYVGMMIRPDGSVYPCCGRDFDRFSYGNLLTHNLREIWNNKYYQLSRALFKAGPDLEHDKEMTNIPCLTCKEFIQKRTMKAAK